MNRRQMMTALVCSAGLASLPGLGLAADGATNFRPQPPGPQPLAHPIARTTRPMKIGVIGSGRVGATLGAIWLAAGHQVMFSDKTPDVAAALTRTLKGAKAGTGAEAVAFADVVFIATPYLAIPDIGKELGAALKGKTVIDATNPLGRTNLDIKEAALAVGTGVWTASHLPGAHVVRGFNSLSILDMAETANRPAPRIGILLAADDRQAMATAEQLVRDAGFDAVVVGDLASSKRFEHGGPLFGPRTASELRAGLGLAASR